jgi:hypothetical protein
MSIGSNQSFDSPRYQFQDGVQPWRLLKQGQQLAERIERDLEIRHKVVVVEKSVAGREAVLRNNVDSEAGKRCRDGYGPLIAIGLDPAAELLDYFAHVRLKVAYRRFGEIAVERISSQPV